jgi:hypothetical protein
MIKTLRTGNDKFEAEIVDTNGIQVVVQMRSGEFSYLFTVENHMGDWQAQDDLEMRAYGNTWRHIPGDFLDQLGIDVSTLMADIDLIMAPNLVNEDDSREDR